LEQTQEKITNNHSFGSLFKFCESFIWDKNTKVVIFLGNKFLQVIHLGRIYLFIYLFIFGFSFVLSSREDFVKVFYSICVRHSFICDKKNTKFAFFLCALCIFRKIICEGFSKCKPIHLGCKNNAFLCFFFITEIFAKVCHSFGMKIFSIGFYY
jgi:hypothetical protein